MHTITEQTIEAFADALREDEKAKATVEKYLSILKKFAAWLNGEELSKHKLLEYRDHLREQGLSAGTVNVHLSGIHAYLEFHELSGLRVKRLKVQRMVFRPEERELTLEEYWSLVRTAAQSGRLRLALMLQTLGATGIRVSELCAITAEAVLLGRAEVALKGKIRVIFLPGKLCRMLRDYARQQGISSGPIFLTARGTPISRQQVWSEMKSLCEAAGVNPTKVFPHNLRHLFARCFYEATKDIAKLADVLGHSSIETTRIYLISSGMEHAEVINRLGLVA